MGRVYVTHASFARQLGVWGFNEPLAALRSLTCSTVREALVALLDADESLGVQLATPAEGASSSPSAAASVSGEVSESEPVPKPPVVAAPPGKAQRNAFQSRAAVAADYQGFPAAGSSPQPEAQGAQEKEAGLLGSAAPPTVRTSAGYLVMRTPPTDSRTLGVHYCSWEQLLKKWGLDSQSWRQVMSTFYVRRVSREGNFKQMWEAEALMLPIPVFEGSAMFSSVSGPS